MITIPNEFFAKYVAHLTLRGCPKSKFAEYRKWLRYFLDFCAKYPIPESKSEQVRLFTNKLREKKQSLTQQEQAAYAVSLYFDMLKKEAVFPGTPYLSSAIRYADREFPPVGRLKLRFRKAKPTKRVKSHTFRHVFSTNLLQAGRCLAWRLKAEGKTKGRPGQLPPTETASHISFIPAFRHRASPRKDSHYK